MECQHLLVSRLAKLFPAGVATLNWTNHRAPAPDAASHFSLPSVGGCFVSNVSTMRGIKVYRNGPGARAVLKHNAHLSAVQACEGVTVRRFFCHFNSGKSVTPNVTPEQKVKKTPEGLLS